MKHLIATGPERLVFTSALKVLEEKLQENIRLEPARHALAPLRGFVDFAVIETDVFEYETVNIVAGIAAFFACPFYIVEWSKTLCVYHIIAREENIELMRLIANYVREHARRLSHEVMRHRKFDKETRDMFRHTFRFCVAQRFRREVLSTPCLFLDHEARDVHEWCENEGYRFDSEYRPLRKLKSGSARNADVFAFVHGFTTKDKVVLHPELTVIPEGAASRGPRAR
jgi:hypothetical protein